MAEQQVGRRDFITSTLGDVLEGKSHIKECHSPTIFSPFGLGVLDLALANKVFLAAEEAGKGIEIDNFFPMQDGL